MEVLNQLRIDHLNYEERYPLERFVSIIRMFLLLGDRLSCTSAVKHTIHLEPGTVPINTGPYRLPECQKKEIDRQVRNLLEEGIIVESNSPWNNPILVVPKRVGADGEQQWSLVVDFRRLNEKTIGDAHLLSDIKEILDQPSVEVFYVSGYGDGIPSDRARGRGRAQNGLQHQRGALG
jgi:hypothetical protein